MLIVPANNWVNFAIRQNILLHHFVKTRTTQVTVNNLLIKTTAKPYMMVKPELFLLVPFVKFFSAYITNCFSSQWQLPQPSYSSAHEFFL